MGLHRAAPIVLAFVAGVFVALAWFQVQHISESQPEQQASAAAPLPAPRQPAKQARRPPRAADLRGVEPARASRARRFALPDDFVDRPTDVASVLGASPTRVAAHRAPRAGGGARAERRVRAIAGGRRSAARATSTTR